MSNWNGSTCFVKNCFQRDEFNLERHNTLRIRCTCCDRSNNSFIEIDTMKYELKKSLCSNSLKIVSWIFGISFLILVGFKLFDAKVPIGFLYYFFLITGVLIGYKTAYEAIKYLNKDNNQIFRLN